MLRTRLLAVLIPLALLMAPAAADVLPRAEKALLGAVIAALFGWVFSAGAGFAVSAVYWIAKEAGKFSAKHWNAPGRPWADFNPFDKHRTADDRFDLFSGLFGAAVGAAVIAGVGA